MHVCIETIDSSLGRIGAQELKDVMYKCFIHLGDLGKLAGHLILRTRLHIAKLIPNLSSQYPFPPPQSIL